MKVVIFGAGGLLGRHLAEELVGHQVIALDRRGCDVGNFDQVLSQAGAGDWLVNCAAYTNVDQAERDEADAYRVNALGAENIAAAAQKLGKSFVHLSTDFVFDGAQDEPYDEFARPNPLSKYARSKWAGDELVARVGLDRGYIVRVQGLYGRGGKNFSSRLRQLILEGKSLKLDVERRVQPTWARSAARQIIKLMLEGQRGGGLYHVSCKGQTTWAGFARALAEILGAKPNWEEVSTRELAAPAPRPVNCLFEHSMLAMHGLDVMPEWQTALAEYAQEEAR